MIAYQPHIDGLRAVAVVSVLVFHLNETWLPGGFVGVDVFFVISGYLISKLIVSELHKTGSFSFKGFYLRRIRRLFPAMIATFTLSAAAAYFILSPTHVVEFAKSLIAAVFSVSNFYFWESTSYFDSDSSFKPLLHTWSLAVEEQFYLLWPLLLFLLYRYWGQRVLASAVVVLSVASLALNLLVFEYRVEFIDALAPIFGADIDVDATAFYLLPFRAFELGIGACLVFIPVNNRYSGLRSWLTATGLVMILASFWMLNERLDFPTYHALLPCLGAALVILFGTNSRVALLLTNRAMVGIGLISYSLYLVHWPIIVFYKMVLFRPLLLVDYVVLVLASVGLAALFYFWVEQPFRRTRKSPKHNRRFLIGALICCLVLCLVAWQAISQKGWLDRYPQEVLQQLEREPEDYIELFADVSEYYSGDFANNGNPKVVVLGDSLSADLINAFVKGGSVQQLDLTGIRVFYPCLGLFPLTPTQERSITPRQAGQCRQQRQAVVDQTALLKQADTVILASYWRDARVIPLLKETVEHLRSLGVGNVMVLGQKLQQQHGVKLLAAHPLPVLTRLRLPMSDEVLETNRLLKESAKDYSYFDLTQEFCNQQGCRPATDDGFLIVYDVVHLTPEGAVFVGRNFLERPWFKRLLNSGSNP